jgi:hypothetical protein
MRRVLQPILWLLVAFAVLFLGVLAAHAQTVKVLGTKVIGNACTASNKTVWSRMEGATMATGGGGDFSAGDTTWALTDADYGVSNASFSSTAMKENAFGLLGSTTAPSYAALSMAAGAWDIVNPDSGTVAFWHRWATGTWPTTVTDPTGARLWRAEWIFTTATPTDLPERLDIRTIPGGGTPGFLGVQARRGTASALTWKTTSAVLTPDRWEWIQVAWNRATNTVKVFVDCAEKTVASGGTYPTFDMPTAGKNNRMILGNDSVTSGQKFTAATWSDLLVVSSNWQDDLCPCKDLTGYPTP